MYKLFFGCSCSEFDFIGDSRLDSTRVLVSQFVVGTFVELWLNQNEYTETPKTLPYVPPTPAQLQCLKQLMKHLVGLDLRTALVQQPSSVGGVGVSSGRVPGPGASLGLQVKEQLQMAVFAYHIIQKGLYGFLRLALKCGEMDEFFNSVCIF
jgi:hypothetical protein